MGIEDVCLLSRSASIRWLVVLVVRLKTLPMNVSRNLLALLLLVACAALGMARADEPLSFDRDIRGILSENCFQCHGPDSGNRQAGLRLDLRENAVAELESGARAIQPGDVATSELVARIRSTDPDTVMPPTAGRSWPLAAA